MQKRITLLFAFAVLGMLLVTPVSAGTLYDNGPINGSLDAWCLNPYWVSNSFTLPTASTLTDVEVGLWVPASHTPTTVDWSIGTTYNDDTFGSGTATLANTYAGGAGGSWVGLYDTYESTFPLSMKLDAGTYWLTLTNGNASLYERSFWDINNGPSQAWDSLLGDVTNNLFPGSNSNSFQIYGSSAVPEPTTMLLLGLGLMGLAGVRKKFNK